MCGLVALELIVSRAGFLFHGRSMVVFVVATFFCAAFLEEEDLAACAALPGKLTEEGIDEYLQKTLAFSSRTLFLAAFGTGWSRHVVSIGCT
jgi:hypothetical protein